MFILLGDNATGVGEAVYTQAAGLTYNGSSGTLVTTLVIANLTGTATNATLAATATVAVGATNIDISSTTSSDGTTYPVLVGAIATGNQLPFIDNTSFSYNASSGTLSADVFSGSGSGLSALNISSGNVTGTLAVADGGTGVNTSTGTGNTVLSASPTFSGTIVAPIINGSTNVTLQWTGASKFRTTDETANDNTSGAEVRDGSGTYRNVGFNDMITTSFGNSGTQDFTRAEAGHSFRATHSTGVRTFRTESADGDIPNGAVWICRNLSTSSGTVTIASQGSGNTIRHYSGSGSAPLESVNGANTFTLARGGIATLVKVADDEYEMWGIGITGGA